MVIHKKSKNRFFYPRFLFSSQGHFTRPLRGLFKTRVRKAKRRCGVSRPYYPLWLGVDEYFVTKCIYIFTIYGNTLKCEKSPFSPTFSILFPEAFYTAPKGTYQNAGKKSKKVMRRVTPLTPPWLGFDEYFVISH